MISEKSLNSIVKTLKEFGIRDNNINNLVIGGTKALELHGIITPEPPDDIDIIVYNPTKSQLDMLSAYSLIDEDTNTISTVEYGRRSIKIVGSFMKLNFIISHDKLPTDLLSSNILFNNLPMKVQSISNIFKAQKSYNNRTKDLIRSIKLKELNFNVI